MIKQLTLAIIVALFACNSGGDTRTGEAETQRPAEQGTPQSDVAVTEEMEPATAAWTDEGYRTVFSFADNRHLLHNYDTGLFVDFGHPSALKYVYGHWTGSFWQSGEVDDDRPVAWTDGVRSVFRFPLTESGEDRQLVVRMKASSDSQRMDVFLNGERLGSTLSSLPSDWGELRLRLPGDRLNAGENKIRFHFARSEPVEGHGRTAGAFDWARIQSTDVDPMSDHVNGGVRWSGSDLSTPVYGGAAAYITVPAESRLRLRVRFVSDEDGPEVAPATVAISTDVADPIVSWEGEVGAEPIPVEVDLSRWADEVVRVDLRGAGEVTSGSLRWLDPVLVVPEGEARSLTDSDRPRNILIWLIDTLRPDHYPVYNPDTRVQAPHAVDFAPNCVSFRRATVQGNSSLPASASIHSATYPSVHRLNSGDRRIPRDLTLIAEPFDDAGWATALHSSNGYVSERRRFVRGFDDYRNLIHESGRAHTERLWPISLDWLDGVRGDHWLDFVNTIDPHVPYDPPEEILALYHPEPYSGRIRPRGTGELLDGLGDEGLNAADERFLVALYDGEITYNDLWFGQMIEDLRSREWLDDTVIVITSDHGEQFFEHGRGGHGSGVWEVVTHVPLMFCHPRSLGAERWIETEAETIDIFPTLLELAGLEIPDTVQGASLLPLILDPTPAMNRPGFSYHGDDIRGMRLGRWKYILRGGDLEAIYDLNESPIDGEDRQEGYPIAHRHMRDVIAFHLAYDTEWRKSHWGFPNNHSAAFAAHLDSTTW